jgi:hypothetical protein
LLLLLLLLLLLQSTDFLLYLSFNFKYFPFFKVFTNTLFFPAKLLFVSLVLPTKPSPQRPSFNDIPAPFGFCSCPVTKHGESTSSIDTTTSSPSEISYRCGAEASFEGSEGKSLETLLVAVVSSVVEKTRSLSPTMRSMLNLLFVRKQVFLRLTWGRYRVSASMHSSR